MIQYLFLVLYQIMEHETKTAMGAELKKTTDALGAFLKSHLRLAPKGSDAEAVSRALLSHVAGLTPEAIGLAGATAAHRARIETLAAAEAAEDADAHHGAVARTA